MLNKPLIQFKLCISDWAQSVRSSTYPTCLEYNLTTILYMRQVAWKAITSTY